MTYCCTAVHLLVSLCRVCQPACCRFLPTRKWLIKSELIVRLYKLNCRERQRSTVETSPLLSVDLVSTILWNHTKDLKKLFPAFVLDADHKKDNAEKKAGKLVCFVIKLGI